MLDSGYLNIIFDVNTRQGLGFGLGEIGGFHKLEI